MKKTLLVMILGITSIGFSQEKPKEPTVSELTVQLADAQAKIAELEQQITEDQIRLLIAEKAALPQVPIDQVRQRAQQKLEQTKQAANEAHLKEIPKK